MAEQSLGVWLQARLVSMSRVHFALAALYIAAIIAYDAWNLITPEAIVQRWLIAAAMLIVTALVWYGARAINRKPLYYQGLVYALIGLDLLVATYSVYSQRGIASKAVLLYVIPIVVSAILLSRAAIFATAIISIALYSAVCVHYFYNNLGQAYKVELYGETAFYSGLLLIIAALLWVLLSGKSQT